MPIPTPSPIERRILDFLARLTSNGERRIHALEVANRTLREQNADLERRLAVQEQGMAALSASLADFLAPPDGPPS